MTEHSNRDQRVQSILHTYLQAIDRGEKPDRQALLDAHPDLRDELAEYFADASKLEALAKSLKTASFGERRGASPPSAPTPDELAGRFPQFDIVELLGQGGMGAVYKARQKGLDRIVALKILPGELGRDPAFAERFTREARALARLSHPNIVAVYDVGQTADGLCYFVMEYIDGVNLRQAMRAGHMTPKEALAIVPQICDALQFAHDEGIVHRDIKPENVLLDRKGRVKIADFGLAKLLGSDSDVSLTGTHQVMGTLRYMAPEQMEGARQIDHRADIYSLGVVFYELLTGEVPMGRFAAPSKKVQIDVRLDEVVLRAMEREPEQRWQQASEVKTEVEAISSDRLPGSSPDDTTSPLKFPAQIIPRDGDVLLVLAVLPCIQRRYLVVSCLAFFSLCLLGAGLALTFGLCAFLALSLVMILGSVRSVAVSGNGLTVHRYLGPNRFLAWGDIVDIQLLSPWEVVRQVWLWPGWSPRGSIVGMSAQNYHRIDTRSAGCWYFRPRDPAGFLKAVQERRSVSGRRAVPVRSRPNVQVPSKRYSFPLSRSRNRWLLVGVVFVISLAALVWRMESPGPNTELSGWVCVAMFLLLNYPLVLWAAAGAYRKWVRAEADPVRRLRRSVRGPALAMIAVGLLGIVLSLTLIGSFIIQLATMGPEHREFASLTVLLAGWGLILAGRIVSVYAGIRLLNHQGRGWGIASGILMLVPIDPLAIVALPAGIWALRVLLREDVSEALRASLNPQHGVRTRIVLSFLAAAALVGTVFGLVWATVGFGEAAVWGSLTWLAVHVLLLTWLPRGTARPALWDSWTLACVAVYFTLWMADAPRTSWWCQGLGYIDRHYWPYEGQSKCSVTLTPKDKTFRRVTITNEREIRRDGYGSRGVVNWSGPGWAGERTRDDFYVRLETLQGDTVSHTLEVNAKGFSWGTWSQDRPLTVDDVLDWVDREMKAVGDRSEINDRDLFRKQCESWLDLIRTAQSDDDATGSWKRNIRPVGYLAFFAGREELDASLKGTPFYWEDYVGTHEYSFKPAVSILYVGIPVMIAVWLAGLLFLVRSRWAFWGIIAVLIVGGGGAIVSSIPPMKETAPPARPSSK